MNYDKSMTQTESCPIALGVYQHHKGNLYEVLNVAQHSETSEWLVVYQQLYGDHSIWARPLKCSKRLWIHERGHANVSG